MINTILTVDITIPCGRSDTVYKWYHQQCAYNTIDWLSYLYEEDHNAASFIHSFIRYLVILPSPIIPSTLFYIISSSFMKRWWTSPNNISWWWWTCGWTSSKKYDLWIERNEKWSTSSLSCTSGTILKIDRWLWRDFFVVDKVKESLHNDRLIYSAWSIQLRTRCWSSLLITSNQ